MIQKMTIYYLMMFGIGILYLPKYKMTLFYVCVRGSVRSESMSIIVQQDVTVYSLLYFCKLLALKVSGGNSTHHQAHI
jgi:hypothetical protein